MADIERERNQHNSLTNVFNFVALCFVALIILQLGYVYFGIKNGEYTWTQYFIEYGDSFGSILAAISITFFLFQMMISSEERLDALLEAEKDRKLQLEENQLNRKIMVVMERLDFYSEIYDDFSDILSIEASTIDQTILQKRNDINAALQRQNIKIRYPRHVETAELDIFTNYYDRIHRGLQLKTMSENQKEETLLTINVLVDHIISTYHGLSITYKELIEK